MVSTLQEPSLAPCAVSGPPTSWFENGRCIQDLPSSLLVVHLVRGRVDIGIFLVGRAFAGLGAGILACVVPIYQAEVSTSDTRGAMASITGISKLFRSFRTYVPVALKVGFRTGRVTCHNVKRTWISHQSV
jgi:MFS family permease